MSVFGDWAAVVNRLTAGSVLDISLLVARKGSGAYGCGSDAQPRVTLNLHGCGQPVGGLLLMLRAGSGDWLSRSWAACVLARRACSGVHAVEPGDRAVVCSWRGARPVCCYIVIVFDSIIVFCGLFVS